MSRDMHAYVHAVIPLTTDTVTKELCRQTTVKLFNYLVEYAVI